MLTRFNVFAVLVLVRADLVRNVVNPTGVFVCLKVASLYAEPGRGLLPVYIVPTLTPRLTVYM